MSFWKPGQPTPSNSEKAAHPTFKRKRDEVAKKKKPLVQKVPKKAVVSSGKATLSQKTLAMKFMQRKKNKLKHEKEQELNQKQEEEEWNVIKEEDSTKLITLKDVPDPSVVHHRGRRSFGGFNKHIEVMYTEHEKKNKYKMSEEKELREEVSAEEMTSRLQKFVGLRGNPQRGGKRQSKKQNSNSKSKRQKY